MKTSITFVLSLALASFASAQPAVPDRLLVQHHAGSDDAAAQRLFRAHGVRRQGYQEQLRVSVLQVDPEKRDQIQHAMEQSGLFDFVEPDYLAEVSLVANDPLASSQWHLQTIQAPSAWNITTGSTGVTIAMVDSGVDTTHPDLAAKIVPGWNFLTNSATIVDTMGHGTTTAGAAAAIGDNSIGVAGVAWKNPIMPLVVVDSTGYASYSNIANAIIYATQHGARIVNVSIGGASASSVLQSAVSYAWSQGTVVFASAGNGGINAPYYPAGCQYAVAVGATDINDTWQSWSNYGSFLSLTAPGLNIYTTANGGGYAVMSGTSYSSPIAAGVAALVLSQSPSMSASALVSTLEKNSDDLGAAGWDQYYGWGRVNAYKALNSITSVPPPPPTVTISSPASGASVAGAVSVAGSAAVSGGLSQIQFYVDGNMATASASDPFTFPWNSSTATNGSHTLTVKAVDMSNNVGQASVAVVVNNAPPPSTDTQAPTVYISTPANGTNVGGGGNLTIKAIASDNVRVTQVSIYVDGILYFSGSTAPYSFGLNIKKLSRGQHTIVAKAWDAAGNVGTSAAVTISK